MKINNNLLKLITITFIIIGFANAQSKINVNHLLDYGGLKYMPNSDKPFNGKVFELYDNGRNTGKNGTLRAWLMAIIEAGIKTVRLNLKDG